VSAFTFELSSGSFHDEVLAFEAREALSRLYEMTVTLHASRADVDLAEVVGEDAVLTLADANGGRHLHGIVRQARLVETSAVTSTYELIVVPRLWRATQRTDCRIFQDMDVLQIVAEVLDAHDIFGDAYKVSTTGSYPVRPYCVQWKESDFAFVSRLLEEEGICYYFEHSEAGHAMVLCDDPIMHDPVPGGDVFPFTPRNMASSSEDAVFHLSFQLQARPGQVMLRDYDFASPSDDLTVLQTSDRDADLEQYDFPGDYLDTGVGQQRAAVKLESLQVARETVRGRSNARRLVPGFTAAITGHPKDDNLDVLVLEVVHRGKQADLDDEGYANRFVAIPSDIPFRPEHRTPRPRAYGVQVARVTGPPGQEVHVDAEGRVKVHFYWDRTGPEDDASSCWMRVSRSSAGSGYGTIVHPRVGEEVLVQFIDGDLDRPVVVGQVYNGEHHSHDGAMADPGMISRWSERSSPRSSGLTEIRMDCTTGKELLYIRAQLDRFEEVLGNAECEVTGNEDRTVTGNDTLTVLGDRRMGVSGQEVNEVGGLHRTEVDGTFNMELRSTAEINVAETYTLTSGGNMMVDSGAEIDLAAASAIYITSEGSTISLTAPSTITVDSGSEVHVVAATKIKLDAPEVEDTSASTTTITTNAETIVAATQTVAAQTAYAFGVVNGVTLARAEAYLVDYNVTLFARKDESFKLGMTAFKKESSGVDLEDGGIKWTVNPLFIAS
jgi:type VI secretion system secreted protein VgrG